MKTLKVLFALALFCSVVTVTGCGDADSGSTSAADSTPAADESGDEAAAGSGDKPAGSESK